MDEENAHWERAVLMADPTDLNMYHLYSRWMANGKERTSHVCALHVDAASDLYGEAWKNLKLPVAGAQLFVKVSIIEA